MLVMLIRLIRIALGAHYLRDVIAAIVLGSLWLIIAHSPVGVKATSCLGGD